MMENIDIMKEIGSIAAAHGSRALSEMLDKRINLTLPNVKSVDMGTLNAAVATEQIAFTVHSKILSAFNATIVLAFDEASAKGLLDICCPGNTDAGGGLSEMGLSAISEIGNVVMGAFVGAVSVILREPIIPSIPTFVKGPLSGVLSSAANLYQGEKSIMLVEACFEEAEKKVKGGLYFIVPPRTFDKICRACEKLLEDI